jgi:NagD protein
VPSAYGAGHHKQNTLNKRIFGDDTFIQHILEQGNPLVVLTHYSVQTGKDLQNRLSAAGMDNHEECFCTSVIPTADFFRIRITR